MKKPKPKAKSPRVRKMTEVELMADMRGEPKAKKPRRVVLEIGELGFSDKEGWYFAALRGPMSATRIVGERVRVVAEVLK